MARMGRCSVGAGSARVGEYGLPRRPDETSHYLGSHAVAFRIIRASTAQPKSPGMHVGFKAIVGFYNRLFHSRDVIHYRKPFDHSRGHWRLPVSGYDCSSGGEKVSQHALFNLGNGPWKGRK